MNKLIIPALLALLIAGCSSTPNGPEQAGAPVESRDGVTTVTAGGVDSRRLPPELTDQFKMLIQGNTDERGSREYNLALGQKRSDAIKSMLTLLGAREEQVESVSLGEEKPKNEGHDDAAWAENRRGDMLYSGEF
jgi:peptidoglycan-associated lipoprotein